MRGAAWRSRRSTRLMQELGHCATVTRATAVAIADFSALLRVAAN